MKVPFVKYQGTGNDFIIIDDRNGLYGGLTTERIHRLCDRRFGIGADGLMLLQLLDGYDFQMRYFNADGREGSLCGNGGRCMVRYAWQLGIRKDTYRFLAADGGHEARIEEDGTVALRMGDVDGILRVHSDHIVHTGSPHYVRIVQDVMDLDVYKKGSEIRNSEPYKTEGINVNFVEQTTKADGIIVRTFERGVEDETLSCGTGVTAAALVCHHNERGFNEVEVTTLGGTLRVSFNRTAEGSYKDIWLTGPATPVYEGRIELPDDGN